MNFFDKMKDSIKRISRSSAEVAREGVERISEKATEISKLSKIKMEIKSVEHKLDEAKTELGETVYTLYKEKQLKKSAEKLESFTEKIQTINQELEVKNQELQEIYKEYASHSIDKEKIKELKKELEEGGGTIEQVVITENSPVVEKKLKSVQLPKEVLVGTIQRGNQVIIPDGTYCFSDGDRVTLLGKKDDVTEALTIIGGKQTEN